MLTYIVDIFREVRDVLVAAEVAVIIVSAVLGAIAMFFLMSYVFRTVAYWCLFKKAGQSGWKSIVPIYSSYIRYKITWRPLLFWVSGLLMVLGPVLKNYLGQYLVVDALAVVITVAGWIIYAMSMYKLSRSFGHGVPYALGLIFLQPLFTMILGFGESKWQGGASE